MASEQRLQSAIRAALRYLEPLEAAAGGSDRSRAHVIEQLRAALEPLTPAPIAAPQPTAAPEGEQGRLARVREALGPDLLRLAERSNLTEAFIAGRLLGAGSPFSSTEVALECFGMPNKHERERMQQIIEALERAGLLERLDPAGTRWRPRSHAQ